MSVDAFYSRPGHLVRRLNQIAVALFLEEVGDLDLTPRQYATLRMIETTPGIDQATLSNRIAMDKTTIVKIVDRLVEKGWITRERSDVDRRTNRLNLTPTGGAVLQQALPRLERCDTRLLAPLTRADQQRFMEMLNHLVQVNNVHSRAPMKTTDES
jgi:DNA-binding MarR family transcriptional regulator